VFREILRSGSTLSCEPRLAPLARVFELQGMDALRQAEERFLAPAVPPFQALIPAGGDLGLSDDLRAIVGHEIPRAFLDVYGKPLVQRQAEVLRRAGSSDITLVADIDPGAYELGDLRLICHRGPGILSSVRAGLRLIEPDASRVLVCYSDLLFSDEVLASLLACEDPIAIVVGRTSPEEPHARKKRLDYVVTDVPPRARRRGLEVAPRYSVVRIGKSISPAEASLESVGLMSLTRDGLKLFLDACARYETRCAGQPFGEAARFEEASLTDLLQALIDEGHKLTAVERNEGWLEIHDFEDYRQAIEQYARSAP
jgi:phosphoenolpyruvate phosphomutase